MPAPLGVMIREGKQHMNAKEDPLEQVEIYGLSLPVELLELLERYIRENKMTRNQFFQEVLNEKLNTKRQGMESPRDEELRYMHLDSIPYVLTDSGKVFRMRGNQRIEVESIEKLAQIFPNSIEISQEEARKLAAFWAKFEAES